MHSTGATTGIARLGQGTVASLAMSAIGIALSVGSWSAARDGSYFGNELLVPAVPVVMVFVALALALVFWKRESKPDSFPVWCLVVAGALVLAQVLMMPLVPGLSEPERLSLGVIATFAEGTSTALLTFLFLRSLACRTPRQIAVAIAAGYLLVHLYDGLFLEASEQVRLLQRPVALVVMTALAGVLVYGMRRGRQAHAGDDATGVKSPGDPAPCPSCDTPGPHPSDRPRSVEGCVLLACFVCVPLLIQGVYSQLTGLGSVGNVQEFNLFTELFAAGVRAAVLAYCLLQPDELPLSHVAVCAALACLVGIPAVDLSWGTDAYLVGSHSINAARYILLPLVMIVGVQGARRFPEWATSLVFLMMAAANSCYVSRFVTAGLAATLAFDVDAVLPRVSLYSMWIVACAIPAYLLVEQRLGLRVQSARTGSSQEVTLPAGAERAGALVGGMPGAAAGQARADGAPFLPQEGEMDPGLVREIRFYQRFERLCREAQLTERETEILREVLHGYSIDSIAARLDLSASTVKTYLSRAYGRFGVSSRQEVLNLLDSEGEDMGVSTRDKQAGASTRS